MIIFDYNQIAISNIIEHVRETNSPIDIDMVRHMILNTIRTYVKKYKATHGPEVVIACDSRKYWRKEYFPHYKSGRKKSREDSGLDWTKMFECLQMVKEELATCSHYKVVEVETAEADDIIGTLTIRNAAHGKVMILSSDKDFVQLQVYPNVGQYSPIMKKEIKVDSPANQLKELIIRGDSSDGVPNILSEDRSFVDGVRQKPIMSAKVVDWVNQRPEEFCNETMLRNYKRNELLIDLTKIPETIKKSIIDTYENTKPKTKMQFMNYLVANRLKQLIEVANEF
jgi:hypothetical protein